MQEISEHAVAQWDLENFGEIARQEDEDEITAANASPFNKSISIQ
jgi:hypothetical protein